MMKKDEIAGTIEFRQSTIKDYLNCPLLFRYKHIDKVPESRRHSAALHGTALHSVIDRFHKEGFNLNLEEAYLTALHKAVDEEETPVYWKEDEDKYLANALEILKGYKMNPDNLEARVLFSEVSFRVKIHGYWFTGTIDQVRQNKDGSLELLDLKSSKQEPTLAFLQNDWQLALYTYALCYGELYHNGIWVKTSIFPTFSSWYFLRGHEIRKRSTVNGQKGEQKLARPIIRTQKNIVDLQVFKKELKNLLNVMLKDWHFANPNHCQMCNMTQHCTSRSEIISDAILSPEVKQLLKELEVAV